jgi:hypothetical protein
MTNEIKEKKRKEKNGHCSWMNWDWSHNIGNELCKRIELIGRKSYTLFKLKSKWIWNGMEWKWENNEKITPWWEESKMLREKWDVKFWSEPIFGVCCFLTSISIFECER